VFDDEVEDNSLAYDDGADEGASEHVHMDACRYRTIPKLLYRSGRRGRGVDSSAAAAPVRRLDDGCTTAYSVPISRSERVRLYNSALQILGLSYR